MSKTAKYIKVFTLYLILGYILISCKETPEQSTPDVTNIDCSLLNKFSVSFKNLHVIYYNYEYSQWAPNPPSSKESYTEIYNYLDGYSTTSQTNVEIKSPTKYTIVEKSSIINEIYLSYVIDLTYKKIDTLFINIKKYTRYDPIYEWFTIQLRLIEAPISFASDSVITVLLRGPELDSCLKLIQFNYEGSYNQGHFRSSYFRGISKFLNSTDSTSLTIKISK